jgi:DNA mismatch repair ATPase MutL
MEIAENNNEEPMVVDLSDSPEAQVVPVSSSPTKKEKAADHESASKLSGWVETPTKKKEKSDKSGTSEKKKSSSSSKKSKSKSPSKTSKASKSPANGGAEAKTPSSKSKKSKENGEAKTPASKSKKDKDGTSSEAASSSKKKRAGAATPTSAAKRKKIAELEGQVCVANVRELVSLAVTGYPGLQIAEMARHVEQMHKEQAKIEGILKGAETRRLKAGIKFPIKDDLIPTMCPTALPLGIPDPKYPYDVPMDLFGDILSIWDFFNTFK